MDRSDDRRKHPRVEVFAGNAEITKVIGRGRKPGGRARIVNWSRGGMLMRVPSPRRRFLFFSQSQAIHIQDAIACTLRLPPQYKNIEIMGEIVRAERVPHEPDVLEIALRFSEATSGGNQVEELAALLEPKTRTEWSQRMPKAKSGRAPRQSGKVAAKVAPPAAASTAKATSRRIEKAASQKLEKAASQKLEKAASQKLEKAASQKLEKAASQKLAKTASERVVKAASERVAKRSTRAPGEPAAPRPSARGQRMSSQRLTALPPRSSQRSKPTE